MKVLILPKYSHKAATFRYRFEQYLPYLKANGIDCTISPLFDDAYLEEKMRDGRAQPWRYARALALRLAAIFAARRYDLVWLHTEAFPYAPPVLEEVLRAFGVPYVYDFDDAFFHQYDDHRSRAVRALLGTKIQNVIAGAAHVFAGSDYLREYAARFNAKVSVIPTSVDMNVYRPRPPAAPGDPFTLGWIGSPSTARYLKLIERPLAEFAAAHADVRVIVVGSGPLAMPGVPLEVREWREASEVSDIQGFDVGLMPLDDSLWSRGKCGFKIIQCLACAVPVVASPVGVNSALLEPGVSGELARTPEEWRAAFEKLYAARERLPAMGAVGRKTIADGYSLQAQAPRIAAALKQAAAGGD